jgi:hypothetical protein
VFDEVHLGHRIGRVDQRLRCAAPGDDHVLHGPPAGQRGEYRCEIEPAVFERVGKFVEDDEADFRVGEIAASDVPGRLCDSGIARVVLRFLGEAFARHVPV